MSAHKEFEAMSFEEAVAYVNARQEKALEMMRVFDEDFKRLQHEVVSSRANSILGEFHLELK